jgi:hemoglobin
MSDIDSPEKINIFVRAFYEKMLEDPELGPIFIDVMQVDLNQHIPIICQYWEKLLLKHSDYKRHTMNKHRLIATKVELTEELFSRWLELFCQTMDANFSGENASRAKKIAIHIADNMQRAVG